MIEHLPIPPPTSHVVTDHLYNSYIFITAGNITLVALQHQHWHVAGVVTFFLWSLHLHGHP